MPDRIYTVGHGTRAAEELIGMLLDVGVDRLVDVRSAPGSRRNPQFAQATLSRSLRDAGIEYVWSRDLGGFRKADPESTHRALRNASFRGYADHMETAAFQGALAELEETSRTTTTAIMCAERLWWRCHRRMIADALVVRGWIVIHFLDPGEGAEHALHAAAREVGGGLVYDVDAPRSTSPERPTSTSPAPPSGSSLRARS
jgi:uncharacterized protein (DUF488 family)